MDRNSAFTHKQMMATMAQEGVKRLVNTSRTLPDAAKCNILSNFMEKLKKSGYSSALRREILLAAVNTYRNRIKAEELVICPFHRLTGQNSAARRRQKVSQREDWFKHNPGSLKNQLRQAEKEQSSGVGGKDTGDDHHGNGTKTSHYQGCGRHGSGRAPPRSSVGDRTNQAKDNMVTPTPRSSRIEGVLFVPHTPGGSSPGHSREQRTCSLQSMTLPESKWWSMEGEDLRVHSATGTPGPLPSAAEMTVSCATARWWRRGTRGSPAPAQGRMLSTG